MQGLISAPQGHQQAHAQGHKQQPQVERPLGGGMHLLLGALRQQGMEFGQRLHDAGLGLVVGVVLQHLTGLQAARGQVAGRRGFDPGHGFKLQPGQRVGVGFGLG